MLRRTAAQQPNGNQTEGVAGNIKKRSDSLGNSLDIAKAAGLGNSSAAAAVRSSPVPSPTTMPPPSLSSSSSTAAGLSGKELPILPPSPLKGPSPSGSFHHGAPQQQAGEREREPFAPSSLGSNSGARFAGGPPGVTAGGGAGGGASPQLHPTKVKNRMMMLPHSASVDALVSVPPPPPLSATAPVPNTPNAAGAGSVASPNMGRSTSTFNFLLSKAKASFGGNSNAAAAAQQQQQQQQQAAAFQQQMQYQQMQQQQQYPYGYAPKGMHPSASMPLGMGDAQQAGGGGGIVDESALATSPSAASAANMMMAPPPPPGTIFAQPMRRGSSGPGIASPADVHAQYGYPQQPQQPGAPRYYPPFAPGQQQQAQQVASPSKRGFFAGIRDRKNSTTSLSGNASGSSSANAGGVNAANAGSTGTGGRASGLGARPIMGTSGFVQSPLGRGRSDTNASGAGAGGAAYTEVDGPGGLGRFSRSQSDLHAVSSIGSGSGSSGAGAGTGPLPPLPGPPTPGTSSEFMTRSPNSGLVALPSMSPGLGPQHIRQQQQRGTPQLRSASPNFAMSSSVDDLNQFSQQNAVSSPVLSSSPGGPSATVAGNAALLRSQQQQQQQVVPEKSGKSSHHGRKGSRLPFVGLGVGSSSSHANDENAGMRQVSAGSNTNSVFSSSAASASSTTLLSHDGRGASTSPQSLHVPLPPTPGTLPSAPASAHTPPPLPPGATYQGLLNRNTNISLSYAQLGGGLEGTKEKDISNNKGWKAYRVILQGDGTLHFYKPSTSTLADEAKACFPTTVVRGVPPPMPSAGGGKRDVVMQPLDAESFKRSGLATRDLLAATASSPRSNANGSPSVGQGQRKGQPGAPLESPTMPKLQLPPTPSMARSGTGDSAYEEAMNGDAVPAWHALYKQGGSAGEHEEGSQKADRLILSGSPVDPGSWVKRIHAATSVDVLAEELVYATLCSKALKLDLSEEKGSATGSAPTPITVEKAAEDTDQESSDFVQTVLFAVVLQQKSCGGLKRLFEAITEQVRKAQSASATADAEGGVAKPTLGYEARVKKLITATSPEIVARSAADRPEVIIALRSLCQAMQEAEPAWIDADEEKGDEPEKKVDEATTLSNRAELRPLLNGNFPDGLLVTVPPQEIAQQIQSWHSRRLGHLLHPNLNLPAILAGEEQKSGPASLLSFGPKHPHPLTGLVLEQVFPAQRSEALEAAANATNAASHSSVAAVQTAARHRAAVLRHWIAVASYLQAYGDLVGWTAIVVALCSRPIARLETTWRFVAPGDKELVARSWAPALARAGWTESSLCEEISAIITPSDSMTPKGLDGEPVSTLPYLGNMALSVPLSVLISSQTILLADVEPIAKRCNILLTALRKEQSQQPKTTAQAFAPIVKLHREYEALLDTLHKKAGTSSLVAFSQRSFATEPRTLGGNDLSWRQRPGRVVAANAMVPLLFSNALPLWRVADGDAILRVAQGEAGYLAGNKDQSSADATITHRNAGGANVVRSKTLPFTSNLKQDRRNPFVRVFKSLQADENEPALLKIGTELVLRPLGETLSASAGASPRGSKRFSQDFARSSRPASHVSRRSSLPTSNRSSVSELGTTLHVEVKAATLERLIDVMVMGVRHIQVQVADNNGEVPLARRSHLSLDVIDLSSAFFATYRTFCAPAVLFELLRKRFVGAINAGREFALPPQQRSSSQFPSWSFPMSPGGTLGGSIDWDIVTQVRIGVVNTLRRWIQEYAQDFIDDVNLWNAATSFLQTRPTLGDFEEDPDRARVTAYLDEVTTAFKIHVMRPNLDYETLSRRSSTPSQTPTIGGAPRGGQPFDIDKATPQEIVEYLEPVAAVFAEKVTRRDYLVAGELFERQAADPMGWFPPRAAFADEESSSSTMYKLMETIAARSRHGQMSSLQQALPGALRDACAAQNLLRGWIAVQITEPRIGLAKRQQRLSKMLDAVYICRSRMSKSRSLGADGPHTVFQKPAVAGFVECAITSSLTSSESRIFTAAWQAVAQARQGSSDSLIRLAPSPESATVLWESADSKAYTLDVGWLLGCMAEAITQPYDVSDDDAPLLPWDKYRSIWNLVESSSAGAQQVSQSELDAASSRLKSMQNALGSVVWDRKLFKEEAAREASAPAASAISSRWRQTNKPMAAFLNDQQERMRSVKQAADALEQFRRAAAESAAAVEARRSAALVAPPAATPLAEKRSRRMTALFRGAVPRLGGQEAMPTVQRSPAEILGLINVGKPSLIARLGAAQVSPWTNSQRSFTFHLTTVEGGKYLLQAPNQGDLAEWVRQIDLAAKSYRPKMPAAKGAAGFGAQQKAVPLFGVPLPLIVEREASIVPIALERMFAEIEARGLREQGIYRISGAKSAIMGLKAAFETQPVDQVDISTGEFSDVHTIAGLIKQWFRDLPEPCIPFDCYHRMIEAERIENEDDRLATIRELIWSFPKPHFDLLERTSQHLARVVEEGKHNLMAPHNIGLVFGTSLLNPPPSPSSVAEGFGNIGKAAHIVKIIVLAQEWLFDPIVEHDAAVDPVEAADVNVAQRIGSQDAAVPPVPEEPATAPSTSSQSEDAVVRSKSSNGGLSSSSPTSTTQSLSSKPSLPSVAAGQSETATSLTTVSETRDASAAALSPRSALGLELTSEDGEGVASTTTPRRTLRQREREESIYLDAQDALEALNFNLEEPISLASPRDESEDPMEQLHLQIGNIGK